MSKLTQRKSKLIFETADAKKSRGRYREVVIEAFPEYALVRLKGMRKRFAITWVGVYEHAALLEANKVMAEKREKRKKGRK
jgi:hypothetical protein